jgi:hypothetical protein
MMLSSGLGFSQGGVLCFDDRRQRYSVRRPGGGGCTPWFVTATSSPIVMTVMMTRLYVSDHE